MRRARGLYHPVVTEAIAEPGKPPKILRDPVRCVPRRHRRHLGLPHFNISHYATLCLIFISHYAINLM
jgi:hypothetical protein